MTIEGDLLSASALALAALAVFYGLWGPQLHEAQSIVPKPHRLDRGSQITQLQEVLRSRATPLLISTVAIGLVLLPPAINMIINSAVHVIDTRGLGLLDYDAVQVMFFAVWLLIVGLASLSVKIRSEIRQKLIECQRE